MSAVFGPAWFLQEHNCLNCSDIQMSRSAALAFDKWSWSEEKAERKRLPARQRTLFQLLLVSGGNTSIQAWKRTGEAAPQVFVRTENIRQVLHKAEKLNNTVLLPQQASRLNADTETAVCTLLFLRDPRQGPSRMLSLCQDQQLMKLADWTFREEVKRSPWVPVSSSELLPFIFYLRTYSQMDRSVSVSVVGVFGLTLTPLSSGMTEGSPLKPRLTPGKHTCQTTALNR